MSRPSPSKLLTVLMTICAALAAAGAVGLPSDLAIPVRWDALGRPDLVVPWAVALTHAPALVACLWLLGRLTPGRPVWLRGLAGAATALTAGFAYGLGTAAGLGPWAAAAPLGIGALMLHTAVLDLWRHRDGVGTDDLRGL